jgi:hypothetical protein
LPNNGKEENRYFSTSEDQTEKILKSIYQKKMSWLFSAANLGPFKLSTIIKNQSVLVPHNKNGQSVYVSKKHAYQKAADLAAGYILKVEILHDHN